ncbi:thiamine pyrophosphate-dependent enzyme [Geobacter sp. AOG1]|uniref:thiamine pyrophosphate-dependent enzyme n=1 Tax=Geobacter sp. AOG1 TaxID=1566346 RepID=UPI001CC78037|nr:thiamine pyrophosphate-dependent enzyme [Geobacter sp. AOG1]GFE56317.1 pyruvate ferredoxin oxidoreductase subunit beta [Geobacter sp. AOG1]
MSTAKKKLPKVCEYYQNEDQFSGGVAWCSGCALELNARFISRVLGKDAMFVGTPSCSAPVLNAANTGAWHKHSHYACTMTGVASSATGLTRFYQKSGQDATVVCFTGDGCAMDVGFQPLSGAAERNEKMIYICYDNEGYMNTGVQRSSGTPLGAATSTTQIGPQSKGKSTGSKNMPMVMAMHDVPYVATATLSHLEDFAKKLMKAKEMSKEGFAYIHVFCPCNVGWKMSTDSSIEVCRTAVRTNYFPLWEAEHGVFRLTNKVNQQKPVGELTKMLGKFKHLDQGQLASLQQQVDKRYSIVTALCGMP